MLRVQQVNKFLFNMFFDKIDFLRVNSTICFEFPEFLQCMKAIKKKGLFYTFPGIPNMIDNSERINCEKNHIVFRILC